MDGGLGPIHPSSKPRELTRVPRRANSNSAQRAQEALDAARAREAGQPVYEEKETYILEISAEAREMERYVKGMQKAMGADTKKQPQPANAQELKRYRALYDGLADGLERKMSGPALRHSMMVLGLAFSYVTGGVGKP